MSAGNSFFKELRLGILRCGFGFQQYHVEIVRGVDFAVYGNTFDCFHLSHPHIPLESQLAKLTVSFLYSTADKRPAVEI